MYVCILQAELPEIEKAVIPSRFLGSLADIEIRSFCLGTDRSNWATTTLHTQRILLLYVVVV
jgi:hypothetical protein